MSKATGEIKLVSAPRGERVVWTAGAVALSGVLLAAGGGILTAQEALKAPVKDVLEQGIKQGLVAVPGGEWANRGADTSDPLHLSGDVPKADSLPTPKLTSVPIITEHSR